MKRDLNFVRHVEVGQHVLEFLLQTIQVVTGVSRLNNLNRDAPKHVLNAQDFSDLTPRAGIADLEGGVRERFLQQRS